MDDLFVFEIKSVQPNRLLEQFPKAFYSEVHTGRKADSGLSVKRNEINRLLYNIRKERDELSPLGADPLKKATERVRSFSRALKLAKSPLYASYLSSLIVFNPVPLKSARRQHALTTRSGVTKTYATARFSRPVERARGI